ncbi:MarR family transcriptional regulator [Vibrio mediterranei]|uniref:MarR family winged helix-turn-helix transcriptional regulator n=1 Tax=Vibrio TaxID=662 RepID=UPI0004DD11F7|nr:MULTISPECIES: MarR family transcriptional regulator [Vibrio]KFA98416.1 MarR family transcriptional regulator [Vibrio sp. ER1A]MCF4172286.1 MarR family transcriptional regulator [Vibrio sp. McD22-P3]MCY9852097.1 MarR family transcriptional regulator [Vibrio mediterranei]MDA0108591.1 MarR family transcriptional regulator [Vibrio sp. La 4.2.2]NUW75645.1 MarR family transcriptional regulator [Vibrio mediterranei]
MVWKDMKFDQLESLDIDKQVCFALYSASNALTRAYRPILEQIDLTYLQYMTMLVLWKKAPMNVKDIGADLKLDSGTLTPLLKRLEQKGLVERKRSETDERARMITVTEQGFALRDKAMSVPNSIACKAQLDLEDALTLKRICEQLTNNLMD